MGTVGYADSEGDSAELTQGLVAVNRKIDAMTAELAEIRELISRL